MSQEDRCERCTLQQGPANVELYEGLLMLQHRGQDSAGMVTTDGECFHEHKENGLVKDVFSSQSVIDALQGTSSSKQP